VNYFILRGEEKFGPYTLAQLHEYLETGHIVETDLAQSEGMTEWLPVKEVLGNIPLQTVPSFGGPPLAATTTVVETVPLPANLHWLVLLVLQMISRGIVHVGWALYLANWARKLDNDNRNMVMVAMYPAGLIAGVIAIANHHEAVGVLLILAGLVVYLFGIFGIKHAMEGYFNTVENIGLQLSGVMTFFFSTIYFQFHINKIAKWKATGVYF
jgi:hypothetical protein